MFPLLPLLAALTTAPAAAGDTVRIDCGSTLPYRAADGRLFSADQHFTNGRPYVNPAIVDVAGTDDDLLYRTERSAPSFLSPMRYQVPVPAGDYLVRLHLAELFHGATGGGPGGARQRAFSVYLEGRRVLVNYDLNADVGPMTAVVKEYRVSIADGAATLEFVPAAGDPTVAAIEVLRLPAGAVPPPVCSWTPRAPAALERKEGQCALVGPYLYTFGGYYRNLQATNVSERYDLATDRWTGLVPMPLPTTHTAVAVAGPEVWIIGGYVGNYPGVVTDAAQVYDTQANTWRLGPPLPQRRGSGAAALVGRQLHFFGGVEPDIATNSPLHYVLNLDNEAAGWRLAAPLPLPRCHLGGASRGGKVYALGGQFGHNGPVTNTALVHEYDPLADVWTRRADMPSARSHFEGTVTVLDGRILTVGGNDHYTAYEDVLSYDPDANRWQPVCELPVLLLGASARVLGNTLIVGQGEIPGILGPETATRSAPVARTPSTLLRFSRPQLATQLAPGATAALPNLLWTHTGAASYTLTPTALPGWLALAPGAANSTADALGRAVDFRVDATGLAPGTYAATVQATAPGYVSAAVTVTLTVAMPSAVAPGQAAAQLRAVPNPAVGYTVLHFNSLARQQARVEVRSNLGQLVWHGSHPASVGTNRFAVPTDQLAPGVYLVQVHMREGTVRTRLLTQ